jgi:two-component system response regulator DevR
VSDPDDALIGVLIVDDHRMFGESLARLLGEEDGILVLGVATSGSAALQLADRTPPQVLLVDYQMPEQDGLAVAAEFKRRTPQVKVVMLTGSTEDRVLLAAIDLGCSGFLTKDRAAAEVADAVRAAAAGEAVISPALLARLLPRLNRNKSAVGHDLTDREREILGLMASGRTNKSIASELHLSVNTVRNYVQAILTRLGAHSKLEAVSMAVREGVIEYPAAP